MRSRRISKIFYTYDANGNIAKAERFTQAGLRYDSLTYFYELEGGKRKRNRLYHLRDNAASSVVPPSDMADIDQTMVNYQNAPATVNTVNNYGYDPLGNLIRDNREKIASITWSVAGKVLAVNHNAGAAGMKNLKFGYGAGGHRISKSAYDAVTTNLTERSYYIHDAQGNVMATYQLMGSPTPNQFLLMERPLCGRGWGLRLL